jgi:hypothetical protein
MTRDEAKALRAERDALKIALERVQALVARRTKLPKHGRSIIARICREQLGDPR